MHCYTYEILVKTSLGDKRGTLRILPVGRLLSGSLELFGTVRPIEGILTEEGACRLTGSFCTLMQEISFEAAGRMDSRSLRLKLRWAKGVYDVIGQIKVIE